MELNEYARLAMRTKKIYATQKDQIINGLLGLAGESGEVCDLLKKHYSTLEPLDTQKLVRELGDVLWYIAELCDAFDTSLETVAATNLEKLAARHGSSFSGSGNRSGAGA
jgi:NTP pyrophosphatase (non-canonical NTP hydrolase)